MSRMAKKGSKKKVEKLFKKITKIINKEFGLHNLGNVNQTKIPLTDKILIPKGEL